MKTKAAVMKSSMNLTRFWSFQEDLYGIVQIPSNIAKLSTDRAFQKMSRTIRDL